MKENIKSTRLANGPVVLTDTMDSVRSATLGFFYRNGSRQEPADLNGITHFIEHCVFKGSARRNAREIAAMQDRLGGNLDAFTTHEETGFVLKVVDDKFDAAFDLLSDMLFDPRFDAEDLANEQNVIIEEIKMNEDSPEDVLTDIFYKEVFKGDPLSLPITGTPETVRSFDRETTRSFHLEAFSPARLIVAAAGNVDHDRLVDRVQKLCDVRTTAASPADEMGLEPPMMQAPLVVTLREDLEQAHLILGLPMVDARDQRRYAADLLAGILGGGSSSRLWQRVREERGLAYSVGASTVMYNDCGYFSISASASPSSVAEIITIVADELSRMKREGPTDAELELMKEQTRAGIILDLEDSASRAGSLAQCELVHGRQISVEESLANIEAVTAADIQQLAFEFFKTETIALVALGDLGDVKITRESLEITA